MEGMMKQKNVVTGFFSIVFFLTAAVNAIPPFLWYATHSIENYVGNGCACDTVVNGNTTWISCPYLEMSHDEAEAFHNALVNIGIGNCNRRYFRKDNSVTAELWAGNSAEINGVDFLFYSGHGAAFGPHLGCNSTYEVTCSDIKFHGSGYLKWVQGCACLWFCPPQYADGIGEFSRWFKSFQGVHTVQGHRAVTYESEDPQALMNDFWNDWVNGGKSIDNAWKSSQIEFVYQGAGIPGLMPATMAANETYAYETWESASDVAAPAGAFWFSWRQVGNPEYE
jgi:hypothetical protein